MKTSKILFNVLVLGILLAGCSKMSDYPKLRDVPTDVKPSLTFEDAQKELAEMEQERNVQKARP